MALHEATTALLTELPEHHEPDPGARLQPDAPPLWTADLAGPPSALEHVTAAIAARSAPQPA
jgi:hypothetical protein